MEISASMVKDLREKTGAGMLDCKKALAENGGDFEKSVEWLRKKGIASAAKKAGRATKEGLVSAAIFAGGRTGVVLETNCETDFVARTDQFRAMIKDVAEHIAAKKPADIEQMMAQPFNKDSSKTVTQVLQETIATLGENMSLRRFALYEAPTNGAVYTYIHGEGKVGVMVELGVGGTNPSNDQLAQFGRDVCMHIAAAQPQYVQPSDVPADVVAKEKEIAVAQMASQNKPQAVLEKIAEGKIKKFYEEVCLIHQPFVKNPDQTIDALTKSIGKTLGTDLSIKRFTRFVLGDGIVASAE